MSGVTDLTWNEIAVVRTAMIAYQAQIQKDISVYQWWLQTQLPDAEYREILKSCKQLMDRLEQVKRILEVKKI